MDIQEYLKRINYKGPLEISLETLNQLQKHHLLQIPFENLDIHYKKKIDLNKSYEKIVINNRGGFCYELNSIFFQLLKTIGFTVKLISARVYNKEKGFGPEFDHMAIIAEINSTKYLVDAGFGEFAFYPLKIETGITQADPRGIFLMQIYNDTHYIVYKKEDLVLTPQYIFSEVGYQVQDFTQMFMYHQQSPDSHFTQKRLCSLPTEEGRITITGNSFQIKANGELNEMPLENENMFYNILWNSFKIRL